MSLGPIMLDLAGPSLSDEDRDILRHPLVGGVILFTRNYDSPEQLTELVNEMHRLRDTRLLVAVDHEGGRVQRFRDGFTRLPPVGQLGKLYDAHPRQALRLAELTGWLMAAELRATGVDLSFAPVLDLDYGKSTVIGDRAFHRAPEVVAELAHAYTTGMQRAGAAAVGKHFPGHGGVVADTHTAIATDERRYEDLVNEDLLPFERMIHFGLPGIMAAHVIYPRVDRHPAGFSRVWLHEVLRKRLGFQGAIFSDDVSMAGAADCGDIPARVEAARAAGCDMVLICNDRAGAVQTLDAVSAKIDPASGIRLARLHGRAQVSRQSLLRDPHWHKAVKLVEQHAESPLLEMKLT